MSITFWAPDAPTKVVHPFEDEPDYTETVSTLPELNVAQSNAAELLRLVGIPDDDDYCCGTVEVQDMGPIIERLTFLVNDTKARSSMVREGHEEQASRWSHAGNIATIERGPRMIFCGNSDERIHRYVSTLLDLFVQARTAGYVVSWG